MANRHMKRCSSSLIIKKYKSELQHNTAPLNTGQKGHHWRLRALPRAVHCRTDSGAPAAREAAATAA